ncbi:hypothetical protein C7S17_1832 [Burkholderia thailandensis]|nr:hypothetical protein [Burkholderia thailandensis]
MKYRMRRWRRNSIKPNLKARGRKPKKQAKSIAYENATHFHLPLNMTFS